jgi:hypothetical protein
MGSLLLLFSVSACDKDTDTTIQGNAGDKQIRLVLPGTISFNGAPVITSGQNNLFKFNIDYYPGVDSVIYTIWSSVSGAGNKCSIELFNITDNIPLPGTLIEAPTNSAPVLYQSPNIKNSFPHKEIEIGLKIKGDISGQTVNAVTGFLYLYRK